LITPSLLFKIEYLCAAPVYMMPALIALKTRRNGRVLIAIGCLLIWGSMYLNAGTVFGLVGRGFWAGFPLRPGTILSWIGWLVLFRFAIHGEDQARLS
jgi:hypothetical protein